MKSIVSKRWLLARLYEPDMIIADCRSLLGQAGAGRTQFNEDHIPGRFTSIWKKTLLLLLVSMGVAIPYLM